MIDENNSGALRIPSVDASDLSTVQKRAEEALNNKLSHQIRGLYGGETWANSNCVC
jgi:hypothetical protein